MVAWAPIIAGAKVAAPYIAKGASAVMGLLNLFGDSGKANSAEMSYQYSKQLQQHQYELNRATRQTAFGDTRQSLEDADYNPLLAVGQQANGGVFGASMSVQDPKSERLANAIGTANAFVNIMQQQSQSKLNSAQSALAEITGKNDTNRLGLESLRNSAMVSQLDEQTRGIKIRNDVDQLTLLDTANATLENIRSDTSNKNEQKKLAKAQQNVAKATMGLIGAQTGYTYQQTSNARAENSAIQARTRQTEATTKSIEANNRWVNNHPKQASFTQGVGQYVGALGKLLGGSTTINYQK